MLSDQRNTEWQQVQNQKPEIGSVLSMSDWPHSEINHMKLRPLLANITGLVPNSRVCREGLISTKIKSNPTFACRGNLGVSASTLYKPNA